ncbi:MAG: hypothetical protein ACYSR1_05670, partial [Planctomycetota bacterium]
FKNETATQMKVIVKDDSGTILKTKTVDAESKYTFKRIIGCKRVRTCTFTVTDNKIIQQSVQGSSR